MRLVIAVTAAVLTTGAPVLAQPSPAIPIVEIAPQLVEHRFDNGLRLIVIPDRRVPVVTHMIWYAAGSADEPRGASGIAHFLEHMMFKGTERFPAGSFSRRLAELGGQENAFTSFDYTAYFQRAAREHLPLLMEFEADRMKNLVIREQDVVPERDVVIEERKQRTDSSPAAILSEAVEAALYQNHPYGIPIIGWEHEIRKLGVPELAAFYERFYTPANAIVIVAGDVEPAEAIRIASQTYGRLPQRAGASIGRERVREPEPRAARRVHYADARVTQPSITRAYLVPSYATMRDGTAEALDVLGDILGGATGRLNRTLVRERGLAASAFAGYWGSALDYGRFTIGASPRPGVGLADLEAAIDAVLAEVARDGVTQAEVDRARTGMLATSIFAQDNQAQLARIFGFGLMTGSSVQEIRGWPRRLVAVTPEAVREAARTWLDIRRSVTGTLTRADTPNRS